MESIKSMTILGRRCVIKLKLKIVPYTKLDWMGNLMGLKYF